MWDQKRYLVGLVALLVILAACAPTAAPAPATSTPPPAVETKPAIGPEEAAWQRVVEVAKKEGTVTVYSQFSGEVALAVTKTFRERTGMVVENVSGTEAAHTERVKAERRAGTPMASVMHGSILGMISNKQDGLLQRIGYLPSLADEAAWIKSPIYDGEGYIITSALNLGSPWINTKLVKPGEEPRSWRDLLQPQWKGKIDAINPELQIGWVWRMYYYFRKDGLLDDAYFRQLGKQVTWSINNRASGSKLARGEAHIQLMLSSVPMGPFVLEGAPVKTIDMEEGLMGIEAEPYTLLDRAPHPNAARLFVNFILSKEGQTLFHKHTGSRGLRKDVPDFTPLAGHLSPKRVVWATPEGEMEVVKLFQEKTVAKLMKGR